MGWLQRLFGGGPKTDIGALVAGGATIIDVRTKPEFDSGHVRGSVNIPLDQVGTKITKYPKDAVLVMCCRSGARSASAVSRLRAMGYTNVHNGGSWMNLKNLKK